MQYQRCDIIEQEFTQTARHAFAIRSPLFGEDRATTNL
jgi:hypothetical protein